MEQLSLIEEVTFSVDEMTRTLRGLVVPWDTISSPNAGGRTFRFAKGSIKAVAAKFVKLFEDHSPLKNRGRALDMQETDRGLEMLFLVNEGEAGDLLLAQAKNGLKTGLSVGVEFDATDTEEDPENPGSFLVNLANLNEVSVVKEPSFNQSRIAAVMMSKYPIGETMDNENTAVETEPTVKTNDQEKEIKTTTFSIPEGYELVKKGDGPTPVIPRQTAVTQVKEPANYVFDKNDNSLKNGKYDFGIDMVQGLNPQFNNVAARQRVDEFITAQFDVVTSNVNELAPTRNVNRYVDLRDYRTPVFDAVNKGTVAGQNGGGTTPFQWPIYSSSSGLVAAGSEGTEPSSGSYVTSLGTVTPTTLRGKAKISREIWDAGTVPNLGNVIFGQMIRDYKEALEAKVVAVLDAASPTSLGTFTAGNADFGQTLTSELITNLAKVQFARGGFSMGVLFGQADLYVALVGALDDSGRPIFPALGATNADGTVGNKFGAVNINGVTVLPTWALAAIGQTTAASSYLVDPTAVDAWADAPRRLFFDETEVSNVYLGVWGYAAAVINDIAGVREVIWDPTSGD